MLRWPEAWSALDRALAAWVRAHGGSPLLAQIAGWASYADEAGDSELALANAPAGRHGAPVLSSEQIAALRSEALVGDGAAPSAFVLDANARFALWRNYDHERRIAAQINERRRASVAVDEAALAGDLDALFHRNRSKAVQRQRDAVARVLGQRLFVLTGGPGTGKTTTVLRMLALLQHRADAPLHIAVAAPTGKAAQRLVQSLRAGKEKLRADGLPREWDATLARIPDGEALTVHRLLGYQPYRNGFARGAHNRLAADVVVIDEASMLDLAMLRRVLEALRPDATLVLVGDPDQLTSIATGSILMDIVAILEQSRAPDFVRLETSFRATPALAAINGAVRAGQSEALRAAFDAAGLFATRYQLDDIVQLRARLDRWARELATLDARATLEAIPPQAPLEAHAAIERRNGERAVGALRTLARRQLLCALREDAFGARAANRRIEAQLKRAWGVDAERTWYAGRAVLITRNDYAAGLFNGDVGVALADEAGRLSVWFETADADGHIGARAFAPAALPAHESAFAITIHKSQGSEYAHVAVLLPPDADSAILSRQLLYTGVSRAKASLELWAADAVLDAALGRPVARVGSLAVRLSG
jgi:exodeoxyribonuclease V alpha subunit